MAEPTLASHQHGKGRVRMGRVWVDSSGVSHFVEWTVHTVLESDMAHAFKTSSNADMTATDTQKNTVYYIGKQCSSRCSPEQYAVKLAKHFVDTYPKVSKAKVLVEQAPWKRAAVSGKPHKHGYVMSGTEIRTAAVSYDEMGSVSIVSGLRDLKVLKTTQSGYSGFLHDRYTLLPDTTERMVASSVTASWKYSGPLPSYCSAYDAIKEAMQEAFFGPPDKGVFSPSVQYTLYQMGKAVLAKVPQVESVYFNMPNLHFLPCTPVTSKFENDVYVATSEPHGTIEATITRGQVEPHAKL